MSPKALALLEEKRDRYGSIAWQNQMARAAPAAYVQGKTTTSLQAVNAALARLAQGVYGRCQDCDERISSERHQLVPGATRCLACQEAADADR